ncbi:sn-glycerol-1-phosphate dehydrogenase [Paenibacillus agricola]|uniref:Sn-glycerol-1-phosphate dehydrogenase n=1 Tax=Paenibacillus agricola TaxID=2716264 RepID=A0ABX0J1R4_9BACL|nr:sn-glycerol-1-phosphate dehydrogenase [Paenibacillus agricola]NHN29059.1 sn-glycerol-1-phosphate dehydrogenase [Paenibacillus agricola]
MTDLLTRIKQKAAGLDEHAQQRINLDRITIEAGALQEVAPYLLQKSYQQAIIVADATTYEAAGRRLEALLARAGIQAHITLIKPDRTGDVLADEASLIQLILDVQRMHAEVVIAVGGGTIHDIARYSAYTTQIPFVSVPTAPSVDGFNSKGAPILIRGEKTTILAVGPDAIFADLDILMGAPQALVAAGFGDMLGKYTSLFDWKFGSLTTNEPYLRIAADLTREALMRCVNQVGQMAGRQEEGIHTLIEALIESGLAMLLFGQSHPASGAEHHLSHYWEMAYIRLGKRQLIHGAKVGVATIQISKLYHRIALEGSRPWELVLRGEQAGQAFQIVQQWEAISKELQQIPKEAELSELLRQVNAPLTAEDLGVGEELLASSLREAHHVRYGRSTMLKAYNEMKYM